jgi:hypothetical protein
MRAIGSERAETSQFRPKSCGIPSHVALVLAAIALCSVRVALAENPVLTPCDQDTQGLDISLSLQNLQGCLISRSLAERWARLIMEEKYPDAPSNPIFVAGPAVVADGGAVWRVTFENTLPPKPELMRPPYITVEIQKTNGAIVALPAQPKRDRQ